MLDKSRLTPKAKDSNLSPAEIAKFDAMAQAWWDPAGKYKTALEFNRARLEWMLAHIVSYFRCAEGAAMPLQKLSVLDVGCGGGLIAEPLAKAGAEVTGIDASGVSIEVAKHHAEQEGVRIHYRHGVAEDLLAKGNQYDVVINAEVVEHVPDQAQLIKECCQLVKPGGMLLLATLNRTIKSFVIAIIGAEYVMRYLPRGTHDWRYFVRPEELERMAQTHGARMIASTGMKYNIFSGQWYSAENEAVNYIQAYSKSP
ncbi:bifunctional 2-polyprenyl-6-hydroxyphenol methylase/3-demethylubiquinol 3-O-methyltransferase UbiG [Lacimicrobium alkaliphilum]|uniref:Ubiquinone biosynthesis O-methyltransferase n=1 Tax=Lacimicrobium alkaliphilum TaxID=1526571 RepID=A0ABQ1RS05_9ALTE|nr:bifunctional 2-polyprenyl-6-hydroxyphenol methylase/3-demethylubiquinol 3-O-methyltransferase UbiG [Lacimicrobium alkaliphilum]GGD76150.1 ubiquinone biosynthesis O-methyltransferase [Lacimicrobium alkaliphilum]